MMYITKLLFTYVTVIFSVIVFVYPTMAEVKDESNSMGRFVFEQLSGGDHISLSDFDGQVIMVVNTASKCGLTGQYEGLEQLYQTYKDRGFVILGVPSNDFGEQEPGNDAEIAQFCKLNFGVSFPMTTKYSVRGRDAHPFYNSAQKILGISGSPKWNFHKYLIGRDQQLIDYFHSTTAPDAKRLVKAVEDALSAKPKTIDGENITKKFRVFGAPVEVTEVMTADDLATKIKTMKPGDTTAVKFSSTVNAVCQKKGCWMRVKIDGKESMVRFKDYGFFVPKNIAGQQAIIEGVAFIEEVSVNALKHYAKDDGKSAKEIAMITESQKTLAIVSSGVLLPQETKPIKAAEKEYNLQKQLNEAGADQNR